MYALLPFLLIGVVIYKGINFIFKSIIEGNKRKEESKYQTFKYKVLSELEIKSLNSAFYFDSDVIVKSRQTLENYDGRKFFKENKEKLKEAEEIITKKKETAKKLNKFLESNPYTNEPLYFKLANEMREILKKSESFVIRVTYITSSGNNLGSREVYVTQEDINYFKESLMSTSSYNKILKEQMKIELANKQKEYYNLVNEIIDYANENKDSLIIKGDSETLDNLIGQLFDRTVNSIKKIKFCDSEEWELIKDFILNIKGSIEKIVTKNQQIFKYYESDDFLKIKKTCEELMNISMKNYNLYHNFSELELFVMKLS